MCNKFRCLFILEFSFVATVMSVIFFPNQLYAQSNRGVIKGRIISANGNAAVNLNVVLKRLNKNTVTDDNGYFIFQHLPAISDTLIFTSVEIKPLSLGVSISANQILDLGLIQVTDNVHDLESVEIRGRQGKSYKSDYSFFGNKTEARTIDIPQSISFVTKELIQDKMEFTLKDAIGNVAGVNQYSGYDEYTIRGFRAENARNINGLRGYNTTYISTMLLNIERIEVIKGPAATLYGNCDPGGTINLVTKKPLEQKEAEINVYTGRWNHYRVNGDATGPVNKKKTLLYRFNAGSDYTKSFRRNVFAKSYEIAPSLSFYPSDKLKINVDFSVSRINTVLDRGQPGFENDASLTATPGNLSLIQQGDFLHETDIASNITLTYSFNNRLHFNSGYLNYYTNQMVAEHGLHDFISRDSVSLYFTTWRYPTYTNTLTNYVTFKTNTGKVIHELLLGYDLIHSNTSLRQQYYELPDLFGEGSGIVGTFSLKNLVYFSAKSSEYKVSGYDQDASNVDASAYHTQGVYLQDQISYKRWKFLLGIREEFYSAENKDESGDSLENGIAEKVFLPRIGVVYSLNPNVNLYTAYNNGFDPFEASIATQIFDAPFKPVRSELFEAGLKVNVFNNALSASLAIYQLRLQNVAVNANNVNNPNLFVQQGENRSRGIETEASGNILANLSVYLTYAFADCKVIKSNIASQVGMQAENAPHNTSGSYIKYTFSAGFFKGLSVSGGFSSEGQRNTLDSTVILPGYIIFNTGLQYTCHHFKLSAVWKNINSKIYWTGGYNNTYKWPGELTNVMLDFSYRF